MASAVKAEREGVRQRRSCRCPQMLAKALEPQNAEPVLSIRLTGKGEPERPPSPHYDDVREPWWLALTDIGPIQIGRRKRVWAISWVACAVRGIVTDDEVTKGETYVHAWNKEDVVRYLTRLVEFAREGQAR